MHWFRIRVERFIFYLRFPCLRFFNQKMVSHFTVQVLVSIGQMYGDILYFGTCVLEGKPVISPPTCPALADT